MPRQIKLNADYFTHDSDMRNDPKVRAIRRKFGHIGFSVWNMLLELLTDADNFKIEYSELNIELISGDFDVEPEKLCEIIEYLLSVMLLVKKDGYLYSKRQIERFSPLISKRERDRNRVFAGENTQSRIKKSRVKESKVNIINNSIDNKPAPKINFSDVFNTQWMESVYRNGFDGSYDLLLDYWEKFQVEMIARDDIYRTKEDYKKHFSSWVKIQVEKLKGKKSSFMKPNYELLKQIP